MKIGIVSAVPEEINTIHNDIHFRESVEHVERQFYLGKYNEHELVLVYSRVGKVAASITTSALIEKFKVDKIIFTGLAGAVSSELERGSIILCDKTYQHDFDARPLCSQQFEIPLTGRRLFELDPNELVIAKQAILNFLSNLSNYVDMQEFERIHIKQPKLFVGTIASGDQFIEDVISQKNLYVEDFQTLAVEMEGAAVAQVCAEYKIPYTLIRIISDKADNSAITSLQEFSIKLASHFSSGIIQEILKLTV